MLLIQQKQSIKIAAQSRAYGRSLSHRCALLISVFSSWTVQDAGLLALEPSCHRVGAPRAKRKGTEPWRSVRTSRTCLPITRHPYP
jgi:hypothetical protein